MKKIFCTLFLLFCLVSFTQAQIDRSQAPKPGPAPEVNIGTPASFTTDNGIQVFIVEDHRTPKVTVSLILKKDPVLEKDKVGYVSMEGEMMRRATTTRSKAELDEQIDFLGGSVNTSSGSAYASALTDNFDQLFSIFSDVILHPSFPDSELAKVKKQTLSNLQAEKSSPNAISANVTSVANYGKDHPYGEVEADTTVKNITAADLKKYYDTYWKPNIAYMAFVGDVTPAHAKELVTKYLGEWQKGEVPEHDYPIPQKPAKTQVIVVDRPAAVQTNISITSPIELKPGKPANFAARVMDQVLGGGVSGWLFQDLREKYGYTYGAYSSISNDPLVGRFSASAAVRTAVTDSALMRFMYELSRIRKSEVDQKKLDTVKNVISGHFALSLENPARIAQFAINIARYDMPKDYYKNYLKSIASITAEDVQQIAQKYVTPDRTNIVLVGNSKEFADKLGQFGQVQYVDIYGNPVKAPVSKKAAEGVTAESVVKNYIKAIGGEEKLESVKDLSMKLSAEMMGQKIEIEQKILRPDHSLMTMTLPSQNMTVMKILVNKDSVSMQRMGQPMPLSDEQKADMKQNTEPFPELNFLNGKYQLKLTGIEQVNGKDAYAIKVTNAKGKTSTYYFDTKTGYEVRKVSSEKTQRGEVSDITDLSDYKAVNGILFPYTIISQTGPQKMEMTVEEIKINSGLTESDFH